MMGIGVQLELEEMPEIMVKVVQEETLEIEVMVVQVEMVEMALEIQEDLALLEEEVEVEVVPGDPEKEVEMVEMVEMEETLEMLLEEVEVEPDLEDILV